MGAKRQLVELWSLAWDLCDADADGSVTMDECISIDQKLAKSAGRHFDPEKSRQKFACGEWGPNVDDEGAQTISLDAYVDVQLGQTHPTEYIKMAADLAKHIQLCVALHRKQQKYRLQLVEHFGKLFEFADWQRDGVVTSYECIALDRQVCTAMRKYFSEESSKDNWLTMDKDNSGGVDLKEFVEGNMKQIAPELYERSCAAVEQVLDDVRKARRAGHQHIEDLLERAFLSYDWSGKGVIERSVAQTLDEQLLGLDLLRRFFVEANVSARVKQQAQIDAADFVHDRLSSISPDTYKEVIAGLDPLVAAIEETRRRQEHYRQKLISVFTLAFEICDTGGDGEVSMQECILLDEQVRVHYFSVCFRACSLANFESVAFKPRGRLLRCWIASSTRSNANTPGATWILMGMAQSPSKTRNGQPCGCGLSM